MVEVVGLAAATVAGLDMVRWNGKYVDIGNRVPQTVTLPATKIITQQIKWLGVTHYNPWIVPTALDLLVRTKDLRILHVVEAEQQQRGLLCRLSSQHPTAEHENSRQRRPRGAHGSRSPCTRRTKQRSGPMSVTAS